MNFAALKTALTEGAYSFEHLTDDQAGGYVNDANELLDGMHLWPYLEASETGVAPLVVDDLHTIEAVANEDTGYSLAPASFRSLLNNYGDLSLSGNPAFFYVGSPDGVPTVATYPTSTATIGVQYYRVPPTLVNASDMPLSPARFHPIIVDLAAQRAYMRTDNFGAAQSIQPWIDQRMNAMVNALLGGQQIAGPQDFDNITGADDGPDGW